jgi:carbonic anhydrase
MELHFVHTDASGHYGVLGVLLAEGDANPLYDTLWEQQPEEGESNTLTGVDFSGLLPDDLTTYMYPGSLTTPGCTEGVSWHLLESPASISPQQVERFLYDGNARPVQPVNERAVEVDES